MTKTFSQVLTEQMDDQTDVFSSMNHDEFFFSTSDSPSVSDLISSGFHVNLNFKRPPPRSGFYKIPSSIISNKVEEIVENYELSEQELNSLNYFNGHLPEASQLVGRFNHLALKKAFRALAKASHPDQGGSNESFRELMAQFRVLLRFLNSGANTDM